MSWRILITAQAMVLSGQAGLSRRLKRGVYHRAPPYLRAALYWAYRYILRGGFRDGRAGFVFHFLQGFWYRLLVDAKIEERAIMSRRESPGA